MHEAFCFFIKKLSCFQRNDEAVLQMYIHKSAMSSIAIFTTHNIAAMYFPLGTY